MTPDPEAEVQRVAEGVRTFASEMREQGIHVGLGNPPRCVICQTWPCEQEVSGDDA